MVLTTPNKKPLNTPTTALGFRNLAHCLSHTVAHKIRVVGETQGVYAPSTTVSEVTYMTKTNIDKKVVNLQELIAILGISKSTLYRLIDAGSFPKPFKLGVRLNAWRVETIETWLMTKGGAV